MMDFVFRHGNWYLVHRRKNGTFYKKKWEKITEAAAMGSFTIDARPFEFGDQRFANDEIEVDRQQWFRLNMLAHSLITAPMPSVWNNQEPLPNEPPEPNERNVYLQLSLDNFIQLSPQRFRRDGRDNDEEE